MYIVDFDSSSWDSLFEFARSLSPPILLVIPNFNVVFAWIAVGGVGLWFFVIAAPVRVANTFLFVDFASPIAMTVELFRV